MAKRKIQTSGPAPKKVKDIPLGDKAALLARFKDFPAIDVIERRFDDPNDPGSLPILLKDDPDGACVNTDHQGKLREGAVKCVRCDRPVRMWLVRWINTSIEGRWGQIRAKGYVPVEVAELKDTQDVADLVKRKEDDDSGKTYVRRGDRGQEVLCKMPLDIYNYLKRAQRQSQQARFNSKKAVAADLADAAGAELGDQAGQFIHEGGIRVESMKREHTTIADEVAEMDAIDV